MGFCKNMLAIISCLQCGKIANKIPRVVSIDKSQSEGEGIEALLRKLREFIMLHAKIDVANSFQSPVDEEYLLSEFDRICKEGEHGVILDTYVAIIYCITFYRMSSYLYKMDPNYSDKFQKIICYILDNAREITKRFTSSSALHTSLARLCRPYSPPAQLSSDAPMPVSAFVSQIPMKKRNTLYGKKEGLPGPSNKDESKFMSYPLEITELSHKELERKEM